MDKLDLMSPEERDRAQRENEEIVRERASRYHRVFVQNKDGAKLLEEWMNRFMFGGYVSDDGTHTALAKAEARREFVGMIINQINKVNQ